MLSTNSIENLLEIQDVNVTNIESYDNLIKIMIEKPVILHQCPRCGTQTKYIHNYRSQAIKDISAFGKNIILIYRKRRYRCPCCNKCFYENNSFLPRYHRMTSRLQQFDK